MDPMGAESRLKWIESHSETPQIHAKSRFLARNCVLVNVAGVSGLLQVSPVGAQNTAAGSDPLSFLPRLS